MAGDGGVCIALDVGAPFPAGGIRVTSTDVLCLKALEFLLGSKFVGLVLLTKMSIATGFEWFVPLCIDLCCWYVLVVIIWN